MLSNTRITDQAMTTIAEFSHLNELDLHRTRITDNALGALSGMSGHIKIERTVGFLNLYSMEM